MAEKVFNTRIQNKIDTSENWGKATNFVPKLGEIILYSDLGKFKIGDGVTTVNNLDFAYSGKEDSSNKVTSISSSSTDTQYPSAKTVYDAISAIDSNKIYVTDSEPSTWVTGDIWYNNG